jgi:hypothetical protein
MSPSILKPVAAVATLVNRREERVRQLKEAREKRREAMKTGKAAKSETAVKGDLIETLAAGSVNMMLQVAQTKRKTAMMKPPPPCLGAAARMPLWHEMCGWP